MNNKGFTLIELLIVVAIIAGLAGIGIPKYLEMKAEARRGECLQIIPTIGKGARLFFSQANDAPCNIHPTQMRRSSTCNANGGMMRFPVRGLDNTGTTSGKYFYTYNVGQGGRNSTTFAQGWFPLAGNASRNKLGVRIITGGNGSQPFGNEDYVVTCRGIINRENSANNSIMDELKLLSTGQIRQYGDNVNNLSLGNAGQPYN